MGFSDRGTKIKEKKRKKGKKNPSHGCEVSGPNLVISLNQRPTFKWCVTSCGSKNQHQKPCFFERDLDHMLKTLLIVLGSDSI